MSKLASLIIVSMLSVNVWASLDLPTTLALQLQQTLSQPETEGLNVKVGDRNQYNLKMGFASGSMDIFVREIGEQGVWIVQDVNLGFLGKQKIETLIDPNTGEIKKMLVNGKEQQIPETDIQVVEAREDSVTVPAGTFNCIYFKIHDNKDNKDMEQWVNPREIPINGMLKSVSPSQFGNVVLELTRFERGQ